MSELRSQNANILHYLKCGRELTPLAAWRLFGTMRLAARIGELRQAGHRIETRVYKTPSGKRVAEYWLP
jgi:hypothetical protein